jgi:TolB-like protein
LALLAAGLLPAGCAPERGPPTVVDYNYVGADMLVRQVKVRRTDVGQVLIASLANVDDLDSSSTFGRISADEVGSRLAQRGFAVTEARMRGAFVIKPSGEFMLSDEVKLLAQQQAADTVLVGTYADSAIQVLVSLKLVRVSDSAIVAAADYSIPLTPQLHYALFSPAAKKP